MKEIKIHKKDNKSTNNRDYQIIKYFVFRQLANICKREITSISTRHDLTDWL